jgi:uncharacterized membrane protein YoaT (DUF817 family)
MIQIYILFFIGFALHIYRDYQRWKDNTTISEYLKIHARDLVASFVISCCLFYIAQVEHQLSLITSLSLGYAGDSFFRFAITSRIGKDDE